MSSHIGSRRAFQIDGLTETARRTTHRVLCYRRRPINSRQIVIDRCWHGYCRWTTHTLSELIALFRYSVHIDAHGNYRISGRSVNRNEPLWVTSPVQLIASLCAYIARATRLSQLFTETRQTSLASASYVSWQRDTARCCCAPAVQQPIDISCPPGAQQQTHRMACCSRTMGQTNGQTNRRTDWRTDVNSK